MSEWALVSSLDMTDFIYYYLFEMKESEFVSAVSERVLSIQVEGVETTTAVEAAVEAAEATRAVATITIWLASHV